MTFGKPRVAAVLGPTNTGKTRYAIERMLSFPSGMIGLPLRLLAREVYDKVKAMRSVSEVALVTGEERIVPGRARYWICTVEAMPLGGLEDFVAIDEIQLCADPERGHIFTQRLLEARGRSETLFLGSESMRNPIAELVPETRFEKRERLSDLSYSGERKISRMKPRSAVVGFSVDDVYEIADAFRQQRGGAAVVTGALSPRTRNAQVEMYQNGDVEFLVATDAIGMGLNLDISHVAFAGLTKFDGRSLRRLSTAELAQIAGRAGRYTSSGTFGVTFGMPELEMAEAKAIEDSRFVPIKRLQWRSSELEFLSIEALIASLEISSTQPLLSRARDVDDILALRQLAELREIQERIARPSDVQLLWTVCQIPDFRNISENAHAILLRDIFIFLHDKGTIADDWLERQIKNLDRTLGDVESLARRIAFVRTWSYVAQRRDWLQNSAFWRERTRDIEYRLSDALHERLTRRFVDQRTSVLVKHLNNRSRSLETVIGQGGEVEVEGQLIGRLVGFEFFLDPAATRSGEKALRAASLQVLGPQFELRASQLSRSADKEITLDDEGQLIWRNSVVGSIAEGAGPLSPTVKAKVSEDAGPRVRERVVSRLSAFVDHRLLTDFEHLKALQADEGLGSAARAIVFRLVESFGILKRSDVSREIAALPQEARAELRRHRVRFGQYSVFIWPLLRPAPTQLRLLLWGMKLGLKSPLSPPTPGLVTLPSATDFPNGYWTMAGFHQAGQMAIRIDMLERLADLLRMADAKAGFEASADMLSLSGTTREQFRKLMIGLGYHAEPAPASKDAVGVEQSASSDRQEIRTSKDADAVEQNASESISASEPMNWVYKRERRKIASTEQKARKRQKDKKGRSKDHGKPPQSKHARLDPDNPFAVLEQLKKEL